jgi:iron complex transport system substrate-binding protein
MRASIRFGWLGFVAAAALVGACGETSDGPAAASSVSATAVASSASTAEVTTTAAATTTPPTSAAPTWPLKAPAPALPTTVTDATGASVTVTSIDRIASLQGDITEILWTLGLGDRIVVVDTTSVYPESILKTVPNAGFFRTLSAEGLLAQRPTVVLAHPGAGPAEVLNAVRSAGVPVVLLPELNGADLGDAVKKIRQVGSAIGLGAHAESLATQVEADLTRARSEVKRSPTPPTVAYIVPRGQQVFLTGLDSPSNAIIEAAGGTSAARVLKLDKAAPLTPEALVAVQPQYLVSTFTGVAQAGGETAFLGIAGIAETPAAKAKRLLMFDDTLVQQLGPRTPQAIRQLAAAFAG